MRAVLVLAVLVVPAGCALHETECADDIDNDGDGTVDCADSDCLLSPACQPCGDGHVEDTEACDDGNNEDGDGCSHDCVLEKCGNDILDPGEECDDGNLVAGDGCNFRCKIDFCGDGAIEAPEQCDDGNALSGDGCSSTCKLESASPLCGNFVFDPGEQCDDGNQNDNDGCSHSCQFEFCGDHIVQPRLGEQCDTDQPLPDGGVCVNCQIVHCGNGVLEPELGEQCDDGNFEFGDGCTNCQLDRCGDGFLSFSLGEQCDDGNILSGDGCSSSCQQERCGDGVVQPRLGELCDDASADCVACSPTRACAGDLCFTVARDQPFVVPSSVALQPSAHHAYVGNAQSELFRYDIVGGRLTNGTFVGFQAMSVVAAGDFDGNGSDDIIGGDVIGNVGPIDASGNFFGFGHLDLGDRILDVGLGDAGATRAIDIAAVARNKTLGIFVDAARTHTTTLDFTATRVVLGAVGDPATPSIVIAGGTHVASAHLAAADESIVLDPAVTADASVSDVAIVDIDGDGALDVVALETAPDALVVFATDAGVITGETALFDDTPAGRRMTAADVDGDGLPDLLIAGNGFVAVRLAREGFVDRGHLPGPEEPARVDARDADGDGLVDLFIAGGEFSPTALLLLRE